VSANFYGGSEDAQRQKLESVRRESNDVRADGLLVPVDLTPRWIEYLKGIADQVEPAEWDLNKIAVGL
jgi:hypothetical protein